MIRQLCFVSIIITLLLAAGCSKDERDPCLEPRTAMLRAHAYHHADTGTGIIDTLLPNPVLRPLTGGVVQYFFGGVKRVSQLSFSLSNLADSSAWVVRPDSAIDVEDTLVFYYDRQLRFLSNACGYTNFYNMRQVATTRHALDSVIIAHSDVTADANVVHLKFYY
jgi:hypothetical protein